MGLTEAHLPTAFIYLPTASLPPPALLRQRLRLRLRLFLLVPWRQLRGAALASSHTPLLAFSKGNADKNKADKGGAVAGSPSPGGGSLTSPTRDRSDSEGAGRGGKGKGNETAKSGSPGTGGGDREGAKKGKSGEENLIVIHVCDENRGINRDFTCRKDVLLSEMAYFRS